MIQSWHVVRQPKVIAPAFSMLRIVWLVLREVRRQGVCLIHARSYIPAAVAMVVARLTRVPFIFDMRTLWPEELITAGGGGVGLCCISRSLGASALALLGVLQSCR